MSERGAAEREALWDAWEQVEGRSTEQIRGLYRNARKAHGLAAGDAVVVAMSFVLAGGGSWTGPEVRDGARMMRERVRGDVRSIKERLAAERPVREQIRRTVAAAAAGKTRDQVRAELVSAYDAAGLDRLSRGFAVRDAVRIVKLTWREKLLGLRDFPAFARSAWGESMRTDSRATGRAEHPGAAPPDWSRPPATATRMPAVPLVAVRVELTDDGIGALSRLVGEWEPDAPDHQPDCWLTVGDDADDPVAVHLGDRIVGRLGFHASDLCRAQVAAAQTGQRWLRDAALLTGVGSAQRPWLLRLRIPLATPDAEAG